MPTQRGTGWKAREDAARARMAQGIPVELLNNMRVAAEREQAERDAALAFAAEQERKRQESLCGCPACKGTGELTEAEAGVVANALAYFRSKNLAVDPIYLAKDRMIPRPIRADVPVLPAVETGTAEELAALNELDGESKRITKVVAEAQANVEKTSRQIRRAVVPPPFLED